MFLLHYGFVSVIKWAVWLYLAFKEPSGGEIKGFRGVFRIYAVTGYPRVANMHKSGIK